MKKKSIAQVCSALEKTLGEQGKVLINKFKSEMRELANLRDLLISERGVLKEELALLKERRLEYEDIIKSVNKEIPKNVYL